MVKKFHAPARKRGFVRTYPICTFLITVSFLTMCSLVAMGIALSGFTFSKSPSRYDAMKAATVELSFSLVDERGVHAGHGSGVIISPNFILTAAHVGVAVQREDVLFADGSKGHATLLWVDRSRDVAVMVLDFATKLRPARLAHGSVVTGQEIWSAGYPLELPLSVQHGEVVSDMISKVEADGGQRNNATIFTNVSMAPGDSGGPVFNSAGEVVGLNDFVIQFAGFSGIVATQAVLTDVRAVTGIN